MPKTILHLDDEEDIRTLIAEYLGRHGFRLVSVNTPTAAFKAVQLEKPDLVISDLQLDDADGLETVKQLRKILPDTPMMILTGVLLDAKTADDTVGKVVSAYLEKTTSLANILAEVRRLTGS